MATGMLIGFMVHLAMDFLEFWHVGAISLVYKISRRFPPGSDIVGKRLAKLGIDPNNCQHCGVHGEMVLHKHQHSYTGSTWRDLSKIMVLCSRCYDRVCECDPDGERRRA